MTVWSWGLGRPRDSWKLGYPSRCSLRPVNSLSLKKDVMRFHLIIISDPSLQLAMANRIWTLPSSWFPSKNEAAIVDFCMELRILFEISHFNGFHNLCRIYASCFSVSRIISRGSHPGAESTSFGRRPRLRLRLRLPLPAEDTRHETEHYGGVS